MKDKETRCPACGSLKAVKRGVRRVKNGRTQMYWCKKCGRHFSLSPLPSYTYPPRAIMAAPLFYYRGYTLAETRQRIRGRYKVGPGLATVYQWIDRFGRFSGLKKHRAAIRAFAPPSRIIWRKPFTHEQTCLAQVHRFKLEHFTAETPGVSGYIRAVMAGTEPPESRAFGLRASTLELEIKVPHLKPGTNYACRMADLAVRSVPAKWKRHAALQAFFLGVDQNTLACELPVYLTSEETRAILGREGGLLGHIDLLQVYNSRVYILDYKPAASREKGAYGQLVLYALALSKRTGTHLSGIMCGWFDEKDYFSFPAMEGYIRLKKTIRL